MERRELYNVVLEAIMGYAGACSVAIMDDVVLVNEKVDTIDEGLGAELARVDGINHGLTEWVMEFMDECVRVSGQCDLLTVDTKSQVGRIVNHQGL